MQRGVYLNVDDDAPVFVSMALVFEKLGGCNFCDWYKALGICGREQKGWENELSPFQVKQGSNKADRAVFFVYV